MKIKLQFAILVALLMFLGTFLEQTTLPNQQIVVQFSDTNISAEDSEHTIELIKKQLQGIGVTNIQIGQHEDGKLRITYYSETAVELIQNRLSKEDGFEFAYQTSSPSSSDLPDDRNLKNYELNISEILNISDVNCDFEAVQIAEIKQKSNRCDSSNQNSTGNKIHSEQHNSIANLAIKVNSIAEVELDDITYKIPEGRAGPTYKGTI